MVSFLSHLNPTPSFPSYTGPYKVGAADVEIPAAELPSPSPNPDPSLTTVSFRIFYPCEPAKPTKPVYWLPDPQHEYLGAYTRFLGASRRLSGFLRNLPFFRILSYTTIPATRNATILQAPTKNKRWPVIVFSHGLGGTKNAYSHLLGSISSHGVVVIAVDHRDGSAPLSCIREKPGASPRYIEYHSISHRQSPEIERARDDQLRIRLWELGMIHEALLKIDRGEPLLNTLAETTTMNDLATFKCTLDVHTPGSIAWSGHSFGAATVVQFLKSVFYHPTSSSSQHAAPSTYKPLFQPSSSSQIAHQITPASPLTLLDLWAMPLLSTATKYLHELPLPCYSQSSSTSTPIPGPKSLLVILSEAFFKWNTNLTNTKCAISADPSNYPHTHPPPQQSTPKTTGGGPYIFYPLSSAHFSQSDFGVLFPYLTRKAFKAAEPLRTLRLNTRATLEVLRRCGWDVAPTSAVDMEDGSAAGVGGGVDGGVRAEMVGQDERILRGDGSVRGWVSLSLDLHGSSSGYKGEETNEKTSAVADPMEAVVQGEVAKA
ncbi:MAG: hypothetical protein L6R37_004110 [Teloschistes peruensis]|nr:MAG: hypothetical protein L6R37_004110 [Teloschistes peruensis]